MSGVVHYVVLRAHDGVLLVSDVEAIRQQLADVRPGEHVKIRISGLLNHFQPGVGELLGRWLAPAGDVEVLGGGWQRRLLFETMCTAATNERTVTA